MKEQTSIWESKGTETYFSHEIYPNSYLNFCDFFPLIQLFSNILSEIKAKYCLWNEFMFKNDKQNRLIGKYISDDLIFYNFDLIIAF